MQKRGWDKEMSNCARTILEVAFELERYHSLCNLWDGGDLSALFNRESRRGRWPINQTDSSVNDHEPNVGTMN